MQEQRESTDTSAINTDIIDYQKEKFVALFQARTILAKAGTMEERRVCNKQLKIMKKKGLEAP